MGNIIVLVVIIAALGFLTALLKGRQTGPSKKATYEARKELFSPAERSFLGVLEQAVAGQFRIFGKVRLGDLVQPAKGLTRSQRTGAWNRIHQKHVDFVLCQPDTLAVAAVVELDDASHRRKDRVERDEFVDSAIAAAGIPMVHFAARKGYAVQEVRAKLEKILSPEEDEVAQLDFSGKVSEGQNPLGASEEQQEVSAEKVSVEIAPEKKISSESYESEEENGPVAPVCSACNSPMVKRLAKKGPYAGKWFWACSAFPKCRKVQTIG